MKREMMAQLRGWKRELVSLEGQESAQDWEEIENSDS